jgi:predicted branched-subunit amino acid permease
MDYPSSAGGRDVSRPDEPSLRTLVATMLPLSFAIFVFGGIYGVLADPLIGAGLTILSSAVIFSGSLQFSLAALGPAAPVLSVLALVVTLNMRHVLLGAVIRPRVEGSTLRRAVLSWFLLDESFGIAVASKGEAGRTLLVTGLMGYVAWMTGTIAGIAGGSLASFEDIASAAFPVLFIGLASGSATNLDRWVRTAVAGAGVAAVALLTPSLESLAPVFVAIAVSIPGGGE